MQMETNTETNMETNNLLLKNELEDLLRSMCSTNIKIINLYGYGSYYYGTMTERSDRDFKVISSGINKHIELSTNKYNLQVHTLEEFLDELNNKHNIGFIEAYHNPIYTEIDIKFIFDKTKLKHSISAIADNAYVKARKKLSKEAALATNQTDKLHNIYLAKKSLFHSLRVLDFGVQLCVNDGVIKLWTHLVPLFNEIMQLPEKTDSWSLWDSQFRKRYNAAKTKFREARHNNKN